MLGTDINLANDERATILSRIRALALTRSGAIVSVADQFMVSAANFAIGILAARALGVSEFGRFAVILIIATLLQAIHNVILSMPMMTLVGRRPRRSASYYSAVMVWNVALSAAAAIAAAGIVLALFGVRDGSAPWHLAGAAAVYAASNNLHYVLRRILFAQNAGLTAFALDAVRYAAVAAGIGALMRQGTPSAGSVVLVLGVSALAAFAAFAR
jgi:O-antigen/teichoic acid export membrane protein